MKNKLIQDKQGSVFILILAVVMCTLLPIMAVIFDVGRYRMYQQDIKNAQEIGALACVGVSGGSIGMNTALGSFSEDKCRTVATQSAWSNLGQGQMAPPATNPQAQEFQGRVKKSHESTSALQPCSGATPKVEVKQDKKQMNVQIRGLCFRPMFINSKLLNFEIIKSGYKFAPKFKDEYPVTVSATVITAVYDARE